MDKHTVEARVERLFKEAKPKPKFRHRRYLKLATILFFAALPLSIAHQSTFQPAPPTQIVPITAETEQPTIQPIIQIDAGAPITLVNAQPETFFFCGCSRGRANHIDAFAQPNKPSDI